MAHHSIILLMLYQCLPNWGLPLTALHLALIVARKTDFVFKVELGFLIFFLFSFIWSIVLINAREELLVRSGWLSGAPYNPGDISDRVFTFLYFVCALLFLKSIIYQTHRVLVPSRLVLTAFLCLFAVCSFFAKTTTLEAGRVFSMPSSGNPNHFGYMVLVVLWLFLSNGERRGVSRLSNAVFSCFAIALVAFSGSRSALIGCFFILIFLSERSFSVKLLLAAFLGVTSVALLNLYNFKYGGVSGVDRLFSSVSTGFGPRANIYWPSAISKMSNYFVGNGIGSIKSLDSLYLRWFHDFGLSGLVVGSIALRGLWALIVDAKSRVLILAVLLISLTNESFVYSPTIAPLFFLVLFATGRNFSSNALR